MMRKVKCMKLWNPKLSKHGIGAGLLLFPAVAYAQSADFLGRLEAKLQAVLDQLNGGLAKTIITLAIVFFGLGMLSGRINKGVCLVIIGGGFIIMFASEVTAFFFG